MVSGSREDAEELGSEGCELVGRSETKELANVSGWRILDSVDSETKKYNELSREELESLVLKQAELIEQLRLRIEELQRKSHRQAAPFSKNKRKADPKRPGRKRGEGDFERRPAPPELPSDTPVMASTPESCPHCGGAVEVERLDTATVTDLPPAPKPLVTRYTVPVCSCRKCGRKVRGTAPGLAEDQAGATAHRLGPRVKALAHMLHYGLGIPVRKLPEILWETAGIKVTASALTQDALKQAGPDGAVGERYRILRESMKESAVVHTDDTGWKVNGTNAHLMGFDSDEATVYQIRFRHRNEEVQEIIPADFPGVLVTDRGKSYDADVFADMSQQKCLGHILRNISSVLETKTGPARAFGMNLQQHLRQAIALADGARTPQWQQTVEVLEQDLARSLRIRRLKDEDNQRLLDGIGLQMDRERLLTFLHVPGVEPTNNRAERILRPAVIARKVSQCSKNELGANAHSAFLSVIQTLRKNLEPLASVATLLLGVFLGIPPPGR